MDEIEDLGFGQGKVVPVNLEKEMRTSYIDYAMSVIVSRAIPDVRDGLKPVHRRILYAMQEAGMGSSKPYKKSARIVGEVLGKYHPHGDSSVYYAIVRMAQDFSMRYPLADGHGNFGSVDGDPAAAMRYTEVRMSKISELMLGDIDKDTVEMVPNYDGSLDEPSVLPAKFPQLLVNGTAGIAVGMATNIPPHNIKEIIDAVLHLIDHPDCSIDALMSIVQGPDFPTAGLILGKSGIRDAYMTGRGSIKLRADAHIEPMSGGKSRIIVTELPYQVNKARLLEKIAALVRDKQIDGITDLGDESDRNGMRMVIELRRDANPNVVLNQLYKHTQLQDTFGVIMLALVDGRPQVLNLKQVLYYYVKHQEDVITRRTKYDLAKAEARAHILEGLTIALDHLDTVIATIRNSKTADTARDSLMADYQLSEKQAQAILDLRLQRLTGLEREKIESEYKDVLQAILDFKAILADRNRILQIIKDELTAVRDKYGDERRTRIVNGDDADLSTEDLIAQEDVVVTLTHSNYIKRIPLSAYRTQKRGGRGVTGMGTKEEDFVENILITTTHHTILFFTDRGRVFYLKAYEVPESGRQAKGTAIVNLLSIEGGEKITAVIQVREFNPDRYLFMATAKGKVKKTGLGEFSSMRKIGLQAIKLADGDDLIGVKFTDGASKIVLGTQSGKLVCFEEKDVRAMGRVTAGVKGIKLKGDDKVVGMDKLDKGTEILTVTEGGYGKRTLVDDYPCQARGGQGVINIKINDKTGRVIGLKAVRPEQELMLITTDGIVIRTNVNEIRQTGRSAQGVVIMKTGENDKVASMAVMDHQKSDDDTIETEEVNA